MKKILFLLCFAWMAMFLFINYARSEDALDHWYLRDTTGVTRVRFVGGRFIGVGTNGLLMTSIDGKTWIKRNSGTSYNLKAVAAKQNVFHGGATYLYVASGQYGATVASTDGTNWTQIPANIGNDVNDLSVVASFGLIAATTANSAGSPVIFSSSDGTNWTGVSLPYSPSAGPVIANAILARGSILIAGAGINFGYDIWGSRDGGATWQNVGNSDQVVEGIAYGNGSYVMVGYEGWPRVSTNALGTNWFYVVDTNNIANPTWPSSPLPMVGNDIAFGNGTFVVAPGFMENGLLTTTNGLIWKRRSALKGLSIDSIAYGNGVFVAVGDSGVYQSEPVVTPVLSSSPRPGTNVLDLEISGAIGTAYRVQSSTNLQNWIDRWTFTSAWLSTNFSDVVDTNQPNTFYRVVSP